MKIQNKIIVLFLVLFAFGACSTPKVVNTTNYEVDTLTAVKIEQIEITKRDTVVITQHSEREEVRVVFDTLQRVREVVKVINRYHDTVQSGTTTTTAKRDTLQISQSAKTQQVCTEKPTQKDVTGIVIFLCCLIFAYGCLMVYLRKTYK